MAKILFLSHKFYPDVGGIEVNSEILATNFYIQGHEVHLLTWTDKNPEKDFPFTVVRAPDVATLYKEYKWAEVVFENNPCLRLSYPNLLFNKPNVVALRTWIRRMNGSLGWQDKFKKWWLKKASGVIAVSEAVREQSFATAKVIGNPYRSELFKRNGDEIPAAHSFVFLGRIVSDKGADLAIEAFTEHIKPFKDFPADSEIKPKLTIIGDGADRAKLESSVKQSGLDKYIEFKGTLEGEKLVSCLNKHRYLLVPSIWEEPFGNVALEGMACGCIPIVSDGGGLPDAVGRAGLIFKRGDVADLLTKMNLITTDSQLEKTLRNEAREHLTNHQPEIVAQKYLKVIFDAMPENS